MSIVKRYLSVGLVIFISIQASGQAARSPFTNLTIGEPYGEALINTQGMGGIGVSQPQFWFLNNQNPALLVYNTFTVFQAGMIGESRTVQGDTARERNVGGNLNYLVTAFPIKPLKWTTSVGLTPYTSLRYKFLYVRGVQNSADETLVSEEGEGGLSQLSWSNGVRLYRDLSIGAKASYVFGSVVNSYTNQLLNAPTTAPNYPVTIEEKSYVRDFTLSTGIAFSKDSLFSQERYRLSIGAVYALGADLSTEQRFREYTSTSTGTIIEGDTLATAEGSIYVPPSFSAGISLSRGLNWSIGTQVTLQDWSTFKNFKGGNDGLGQAWRAAIGGEFTPDPISENYFKRVIYRAGVSMEQLPFHDGLKDIGINFGLSMPAGRSSLDLAIKYGKRGNRADNQLEENYLKLYFGITFNDQWFIKRKFD